MGAGGTVRSARRACSARSLRAVLLGSGALRAMQALPIDPILPEIVDTLRRSRCLVLEAPPGAGKTTRVPRALLDAGVAAGEIVVLEPRRLGGRLAGRRVARR